MMEKETGPVLSERKFRCNDCGGEIQRHDVFCPKCGKKLDHYDFQEESM